jgi:hypothetical protein
MLFPNFCLFPTQWSDCEYIVWCQRLQPIGLLYFPPSLTSSGFCKNAIFPTFLMYNPNYVQYTFSGIDLEDGGTGSCGLNIMLAFVCLVEGTITEHRVTTSSACQASVCFRIWKSKFIQAVDGSHVYSPGVFFEFLPSTDCIAILWFSLVYPGKYRDSILN